jgi:glutamyl-tRNA synthetase
LTAYAAAFSLPADATAWFDGVKALAESLGYAANMKEYKQNPAAYTGTGGDVSMVLRVAVTGRQNSPDLSEILSLLGEERVKARLQAALESL